MKKLLALISAFCFILLTATSVFAADFASPEPRLTLLVEVDENCKTNVKFIAFVDDRYMTINDLKGVTVDFYTGNPMLCVYPHEFLGSATIDEKGYAVLGTWQNPGKYAGGAIINSKTLGQIFSNVFYYEVKALDAPVLTLTAELNRGISGNTNNNVTFNAKLIYPDSYTQQQPVGKPLLVSFFIGNPLVDAYPTEPVGSAYLINGEAKLSVPVPPGDYAGGAVLAFSNSEALYSPQIYFTVPKAELTLALKASVEAGRKSTVTYNVAVRVVDNSGTAVDANNWPAGPLKVNFYTGKPGEKSMKLVGSSYTDRSGYASFTFTQSSGKYVGLAVIEAKPYGIFKSELVEYAVPQNNVSVFQQFLRALLKAFGFRFA